MAMDSFMSELASPILGQQHFVPRMIARIPRPKNVPLPDNFEPGPYDVICGRGKRTYNHVGNRRFRLTIQLNIDGYAKAVSKLDKSLVVILIVDTIREAKGGFVKRDPKIGTWMDIGDQLAREKVGHALRDAITS